MSTNTKFVEVFTNRTIQFSINVIKFCDKLPRTTSAQVLVRQLIRSATSIGANFVEAQATHSRKEFINYLTISLKSSNETIYWLTLLRELKIVNILLISQLIKETRELGNILGSSVKKLRS